MSTEKKHPCATCGEEYPPPRKYVTDRGKWDAIFPSREVVEYTCSFYLQPWHKQVAAIEVRINSCPSRALVNLMRDEIKTILHTRAPTMESNGNNYY